MQATARELVESAFAAFNRGDLDAFVGHLSEDVAWVEVSGRPETSGVPELTGRDRLRESLGSLFDAWETYSLDAEEIHELGGRVVVIVREVARGRASGLEIDSLWGYVITVEGGEVVRVEAYRNAGVALQVTGIGT